MSNIMGMVTIINILKNTRAMLMNFCIVNTPRCQILIWCAKYFTCFSRFSPVERFFQKMDCIEKSNPSPPSTPILILTFNSHPPILPSSPLGLKCLFLNTGYSYNKWNSLIRDKNCCMLCKAMLRKMIILLPK